MYAKSFIAHASRGRLTSAATAKTYPYNRYVCHLCKSALAFHPEWGTHRPWFELKWFTEFGHLNRGDMFTSELHR
jgi:hypothetical protein